MDQAHKEKRLDKISKLAYFGGHHRNNSPRSLGHITICGFRGSRGLVKPIRVPIAKDGIHIFLFGKTYTTLHFRQIIKKILKMKKKYKIKKNTYLHRFFKKKNTTNLETYLLVTQNKIYKNGVLINRMLTTLNKGDIININ